MDDNSTAQAEIHRRARELHLRDVQSQIAQEVKLALPNIPKAVEALDWFGRYMESDYPELAQSTEITLVVTQKAKTP